MGYLFFIFCRLLEAFLKRWRRLEEGGMFPAVELNAHILLTTSLNFASKARIGFLRPIWSSHIWLPSSFSNSCPLNHFLKQQPYLFFHFSVTLTFFCGSFPHIFIIQNQIMQTKYISCMEMDLDTYPPGFMKSRCWDAQLLARESNRTKTNPNFAMKKEGNQERCHPKERDKP